MKPIEAKTLGQICKLPRDNLDAGDFWILMNVGEVTLAAQKAGEQPTAKITLPRRAFDRFARWYVTGRAAAPKPRARRLR